MIRAGLSVRKHVDFVQSYYHKSTYANMEIERLRDLKAIGYRSMGVKISFLLYAKVSESLMTIIFFNYFSVFMPVYHIVI